ncbi:MAG: NAD(P)H-binding protein [Myxococcaceae bacterium]
MALRKLFIAGSTGAVGRTVTTLGRKRGADLVAHQRPKSGVEESPSVFKLDDAEKLLAALRDRTTVVQLIGTMRKRFSTGDTYETSDIGTTRQLVDAAKRAGSIDHLVLLSAVGAGKPMGAYLKAKAAAERLVIDSGIPYTIFRPSAFDGEGHKAPPGSEFLTNLFGLSRYKPIKVEALANAILHAALNRAPLNAILEGDSLWDVVTKSAA